MASRPSKNSLSNNMAGIPLWVLLAAFATIIAFVYHKGSSPNTSATSVINSPNNPNAPVTSMGHVVNQNLPAGQVTPNEPGTAPLFNINGVIQYGG